MSNHTMTEVKPDIWECLECGRKFHLQFEPYHKTVLVTGDETVPHSGGRGGLSVGMNVETAREAHLRQLVEEALS